MVLTKICMALCRRPRVLVLTLSMVSELSGSRVAALLVLGKSPRQDSCRGFVGRPGKGVAGGSPSCPFSLHASSLSATLVVSYLSFLCPTKHGRRCGYNCPCTSKGVQKRPLLLSTDTDRYTKTCCSTNPSEKERSLLSVYVHDDLV